MKPIYYLLFSLLTLLACTDQQTELEGASHTMRFGVEGIEDTKGIVTTTDNIESMSVFCAYTGTGMYNLSSTCDWMHNVQVTRADENSEWTVQGEGVNKQWAGEGYHSFFAFAPHLPKELFSASTDPGPPTLTYTVPADHTQQVDLLYSLTTPINCKQMYIGSRPVVFGFRHALAKITFYARKEDIVEDEVTITNIRLSSIINKARYEFTMKDGYAEVANISSVKTSTDTTSFSITPNQVLTNESTILLPADPALFMINQSFTANNKLYVTYKKGAEEGKTITADLSTVTPQGWDFSKAYRYSILVKEDKVTITAQITDWDDQLVDVAVPGTYLNITPLSLSLTQGTAGDIYYSTDGSPVTVSCDNGITLAPPVGNKITFPATAAVGNYIVTVSAGKLKREVPVEVKYPPYIQIGNLLWATGNLVADGPNDCKIGQPEDGGLYFKFGSMIGWTGGATGDGTGHPNASLSAELKVKPVGYEGWTTWDGHGSGWPGEDIVKAGHGDPCRFYLGNGWRLPTAGEFKALFNDINNGTPWDNIPANPNWSKQGDFSSNSESYANLLLNPLNFLLRASGLRSRDSSGSLIETGTNGTYWSSEQVNNQKKLGLYFGGTNVSPQSETNAGNAFPIRCVKNVGGTVDPEPENPDFIVEDGVAAPRIFVQGTGDNAKLMLTKKPANYGAYFQFMGITAWVHNEANNFGDVIYKPITSNDAIGTSNWKSANEHSVSSLKDGKGDPCRLVGYTQQRVKDMLNAHTVPDNGKWKTPENNTGISTDNRGNWKQPPGTNINGHYLINTSTPSDFLPAAGFAWRGGDLGQRGSAGAYWTQESPHTDQGSPLYIQPTGFNITWQQHHSLRMSVRCVRQ